MKALRIARRVFKTVHAMTYRNSFHLSLIAETNCNFVIFRWSIRFMKFQAFIICSQ